MTQQKEGQQPGATEQESPKYLWHEGKLVPWESATVHISQLGWSSIGAVFEGIRAYWNDEQQELFIFHLEAHLKRLFQSMKIMRMTCPYPKDELIQAITDLLRANEYRADTYVQPLAYFSGAIPGYQAVLERPGEIVITTRPSPTNLGTGCTSTAVPQMKASSAR